MRGENCGGGYGRGASCTELRASVVFAACGGVVSSSLRSLSDLTFPLSAAFDMIKLNSLLHLLQWPGGRRSCDEGEERSDKLRVIS